MDVFLAALAAFAGGALISWVNYLLLRRLLLRGDEGGAALASPIRMILSAAYFAGLYFLGKRTELSQGALLIGGALGLTIALALFTLRLSRSLGGKGKE